ncbi:MAG TPA: hypothetical protein VD947_03935 [Patescibacteria group bacterium]|nr:hypothetical protein [Patescibacteria group bacterium]
MSKSDNPSTQKLMDEIDKIDPNDSSLEEKLHEIALKVAEEQKKIQAMVSGSTMAAPAIASDPADAFACEGCQ